MPIRNPLWSRVIGNLSLDLIAGEQWYQTSEGWDRLYDNATHSLVDCKRRIEAFATWEWVGESRSSFEFFLINRWWVGWFSCRSRSLKRPWLMLSRSRLQKRPQTGMDWEENECEDGVDSSVQIGEFEASGAQVVVIRWGKCGVVVSLTAHLGKCSWTCVYVYRWMLHDTIHMIDYGVEKFISKEYPICKSNQMLKHGGYHKIRVIVFGWILYWY